MMRTCELAKRLGWLSKRVIATLKERAEFVGSAMSKVEDPVARAMLRDFAADVSTPREQLPDDAIDPAIYGWSAASAESDADGRSFAADLARVKSQPAPKASDGKPRPWLPPIRRVLLYEMSFRGVPVISLIRKATFILGRYARPRSCKRKG